MMDETPSTSNTEANSRSSTSSIFVGLVASVAITTALALAAAHAPARIRLIGLFSVVFGLIVGWLLNQLAERLECHVSRWVLGIAATALTICGLIGSAWETVRWNEAAKPKSDNDAIAQRLIEQLQSQSNPADDHGKIGLTSPVDSSSVAQFRSYLRRRLRPIGEWSSPWPEVFWCAELCTAAATSMWVATRKRSV